MPLQRAPRDSSSLMVEERVPCWLCWIRVLSRSNGWRMTLEVSPPKKPPMRWDEDLVESMEWNECSCLCVTTARVCI